MFYRILIACSLLVSILTPQTFNQALAADPPDQMLQQTVTVASATAVGAGGQHTCALTTEGGVRCWGENSSGQLGDGSTVSRLTPVDVVGLTAGVQSISVGRDHTCALMDAVHAGGVKCWGDNTYGQLGNDTTMDSLIPVEVAGLTGNVKALAAGGGHTCALTMGGGVKCWGINATGQLGDGTTTGRPTPADVSGLTSGVEAITTRSWHTCALMDAVHGGGVKCWGDNMYGQLGDGGTSNRATPVDVNGLTGGVKAITAGQVHTCVAMASGGAECWGDNSSGQLGNGTKSLWSIPVIVSGLTGNVKSITAGGAHTCAVTAAGDAKCWGANSYGQLGDATTDARTTPVDVGGLGSAVIAISAGAAVEPMRGHTCALLLGGAVKCWGDNSLGQLGNGTIRDSRAPLNVSALPNGVAAVAASLRGPYSKAFTCALTIAGGVKCWGPNLLGELGDGTTTWRYTPADVTGLTSGAKAIATGGGHACAIAGDGGARCWGNNEYGQLGDGTWTARSTPGQVSGLATGGAAISAGESHTCALMDTGGVRCWGRGRYGQLGNGDNFSSSRPVDVVGLAGDARAIAAGGSHTCALTSGGGVKCWGDGYLGQLGNGARTASSTPVDVSGLSNGVKAISAGLYHTCALMTDGGMKCWGSNGHGQLGDATTTLRDTPVTVGGLASGVTAIATGRLYSCAVVTGGGAKCWGNNAYGQLGNGTTAQSSEPVDVSGLAAGIASITAGESHTCAVMDEVHGSGAKCWGSNAAGELGVNPGWSPVSVVRFGVTSGTYLPAVQR